MCSANALTCKLGLLCINIVSMWMVSFELVACIAANTDATKLQPAAG